MASRLNEDDAQGQNKWADIDDDDDDWAPEAITWGDGTKTTLPHPDEPPPEHPAPPSDSGSVASRGGKALEKPRSPAPPSMTGSPLPKSSGLASGKGLVLKSGGSQEKPTLVAKPSVPAPVKSPWATLPPVDRASPADSSLHNRGNVMESSPLKTMTPPPKEIAADDFSRSTWREGGPHANRELYNSHSGRYEPVPDRHGQLRQDQHPRHPALLQRPPGGADYPAEPSSAFQTTRAGQDVPYGRRRGSSNVSGGSGSFFQRMGKGHEGHMPPPEYLGARRPSHAGSVELPISPVNMPVHPHGPPRQGPPPGWLPRASPSAAFATPHQPGPPPEGVAGPPPPPPQPPVDEIEYQKKLMHERTELARKRRQEQEAREEAERRARIQKKLEALGPPPEKKSEKKEAPVKEEPTQPTHIQQREPSQGPAKPQSEDVKPAAVDADTKTSPPIGPPGKASGPRRVSQSQEQKPADLWSAASASHQDRYASWSANAQPASRNVWGSPNNDRGLGNGTFNTDLGRPSRDDASAPQGTAKGPSPIAPPNNSQSAPQGRSQPAAPVGLRGSRYATPASEITNKWVAGVAESDHKATAARSAERAERERQLSERGLTIEEAQPVIKDTWRQVHLPGDGTRRSAGHSETQTHQWKSGVDEVSQSREDPSSSNTSGVIGSGSNSILSSTTQGTSQGRTSRFFPNKDSRVDNASPSDHARTKSPTPPPPTMEGHPAYEGDVTHPHVSLPKPQPVVKLPPSMMAAQSQPRGQFVRPPVTSYKDAVRAPVHPPPPQHHSSLRSGEQSQGNWQDRINNLLNGSRSPPHRFIGVDPSSKSALDHATHHDSATVSLPGVTTVRHVAPLPWTFISKPMAEECFEEQEMGSLPQIRIPHRAPEAAWQPAPLPKHLPKKLMVEPAIRPPYYFAAEVIGGGNAMRIQFPGMPEPKIVTVPFSATRGGRASHSRSGPRSRGSGNERRGGKRDTVSPIGDQSSTTSGRSGRGGYRSRGSGTWHRQSGTPPSMAA